MPFSMTANQKYQSYKLFYTYPNSKTRRKIVTLQVRILILKISDILYGSHGKKAFLSVPGSLTLEAAMSLTLFIFASVCLILPMKILNTERKVQAALEAVGEDFSRYAYIEDAVEQSKLFAVTGAGDFAKEFSRRLVSGMGEGYAQAQVMAHADTPAMNHVTMIRSEILEDEEMIDLVLDYEIRLPFPVLSLPALERTARCRRRAWVGMAGKDYGGGGAAGMDDPNRTVYVGKNSTRYHVDRSCHYLANDLKTVSRSQVDSLRNDLGKKYHPCAVCGSSGGNSVFVMPGGESYHTNKNCSAIVAYVRAVKLSEVEHLGPCSYCSK